MITCPWVSPGGFPGSNRTASPKSASTAVKSFFSKTFLLLKSLRTRQAASLGRVYYSTRLNHTAARHVASPQAQQPPVNQLFPSLPGCPAQPVPADSAAPRCPCPENTALCCLAQSQPNYTVKEPQNKSKEWYKGGVLITAGSSRHRFLLWAPAADPHLWTLLTFLIPHNKCKTG